MAERARVFGMRVCFYDTFATPRAGFDDCAFREFDDLLRESDVVSIHVDLNRETHHLIDARALSLMKPNAWVINTSRGPVINQKALAAALASKKMAGAVLDVLEDEPPDADDPILTLDNAIIFPHIGSATVETRAAMLDLAVANFTAVMSGQVPAACVNPEVLERAMRRR